MKQKVTRGTIAGKAYIDLQKRARADGRNTDELLREYVFERFLYRVSLSQFHEQLVLKGGMLMAVLEARRSTQDIDMMARSIPNDADSVSAAIKAIIDVGTEDDGVSFEPDQLQTEVIRVGDIYSGIRAELPASLATARINLKLDINFGDAVTPAPSIQPFPTLLEWSPEFSLLCYPLEMVLAEKIETMIRRGDANTRWRDFADVLLLTRRHEVGSALFKAALSATCRARKTPWMRVGEAIETLAAAGDASWLTFRDSRALGQLPAVFEEVIREVCDFADPILAGDAANTTWKPQPRRWVA